MPGDPFHYNGLGGARERFRYTSMGERSRAEDKDRAGVTLRTATGGVSATESESGAAISALFGITTPL